MDSQMTSEQIDSIKKSYFNILAFFLEKDKIESKYLRCLLKWGFQLKLGQNDLAISNMDVSQLSFTEPLEKVESIFHIMYLIYLDNVVEDVELEIATLYSERLGFSNTIISDLFSAIADIASEEEMPHNLRAEVEAFMKLHNY